MTIEQARDKAAESLGYGDFINFSKAKILTPSEEEFTTLAMQIFADSAVQAERERIMQALPELSIHSLTAEYQQLQREQGSDYAGGYFDGAETYFNKLKAELKQLLTPTDKP